MANHQKASEAKVRREHRDTGDAKGRNESLTMTALQLCEEVKCGKAKDLEEEGLSSEETVESHTALERPTSKHGASNSIKRESRSPRGVLQLGEVRVRVLEDLHT